MYKLRAMQKTSIKCNDSYEGERIEEKVARIVSNKEPIKDGAPLIYTERKDGVNPAYDIRTDRFEIATEAMDKVTAAKLAKREAKIVPIENKDETKTNPETGANTSGNSGNNL